MSAFRYLPLTASDLASFAASVSYLPREVRGNLQAGITKKLLALDELAEPGICAERAQRFDHAGAARDSSGDFVGGERHAARIG